MRQRLRSKSSQSCRADALDLDAVEEVSGQRGDVAVRRSRLGGQPLEPREVGLDAARLHADRLAVADDDRLAGRGADV